MVGDDRPDEPAARRSPRPDRRALDKIFGEVLPDTTSDERDPDPRPGRDDSWYHENRPPHHDR
ncbi:hypothetical protein [Amycolatopsis sp. CA-230715]|uniref:hypothetical protein n=1 Tax=Amycolatopsis sp. CA-230715 TaxID=2745196 RepID=UPI001C0375DD|nr:hypothetical protein HUW46_05330 [Amycolatopsis sp. CA-230715]